MFCKFCGTHYLEGAIVCPSCGSPSDEVEKLLKQSNSKRSSIPPQAQKATYCKFCGAHYLDDAITCPSCGSPTDEGELLLAQTASSRAPGLDKNRLSGYILAADIISLVMLAFTVVFRLEAQPTIYATEAAVPNLNPTLSSYFLHVKLIMAVIVGVMTIVAMCLAMIDKRVPTRNRISTLLVTILSCLASLGIIFLLK